VKVGVLFFQGLRWVYVFLKYSCYTDLCCKNYTPPQKAGQGATLWLLRALVHLSMLWNMEALTSIERRQ
jgi:hypothetical protein